MARYTRTRILRDQLKARTEEKWELLHESQRWERTARELAQVCEAQEAEIAALKAEVEWLRARVAWVSVEERLPEAYDMVWAAGNRRCVLAFYGLVKGWQEQLFDRLLHGVTHWMPVDTPDAALRAAGLGQEEGDHE